LVVIHTLLNYCFGSYSHSSQLKTTKDSEQQSDQQAHFFVAWQDVSPLLLVLRTSTTSTNESQTGTLWPSRSLL